MRLTIEIDYVWDLDSLTEQQKQYLAANPYHEDNMERIITKTAANLLEENNLGSSNAEKIHYGITDVDMGSVFIVEGAIQILQTNEDADEGILDWDMADITTPARLFYSTQPDVFWKEGRRYLTKCGLVGELVGDWGFYDNHVSLKFIKDDTTHRVTYTYGTKQPFGIFEASRYDIVGIVE